jgi:hypothetical protein
MAYVGEDGRSFFNNRMIIDACRPYDRLKTFPAIVNTSAADAQRLRQKWPGMFAPDGRISPTPARFAAPEPVGAA